MEPDYSQYNLKELYEVDKAIDKERFPERADRLRREINKRHARGEKVDSNLEFEEELEQGKFELIIQFTSAKSKKYRYGFIAFMLVASLALALTAYAKYQIPHYQDLPRYLINVEKVECKSQRYGKYKYYELVIRSWGHNFYAIDINKRRCQSLAKNIAIESDVDIWHDGGVIFHMEQNAEKLLPYGYLAKILRGNKNDGAEIYLVMMLFLWMFLFKSFINALFPGTFNRDG